MKARAVRKIKSPPKMCYFRSLCQMPRLVGVYIQPVLYLPDYKLFNEGMHVWANLITRRHSKRKTRVGSGERASILVFLPLACVGKVFS